MAEACKIKLDNEEFFIPCNYQNDLTVINNKLYNTVSNRITIYKNFINSYNSTNYPYIVCDFGSACYRVNSSSSNRIVVNVNEFKLLNKSLKYNADVYSVYFLLVGVLLCLLKLFHK